MNSISRGWQWRKMAMANLSFSFVEFAISPCPPPLSLMPVLDEVGSGKRNLGRKSGFQLV